MNLGRTLAGGIIGAALAIGIYLALKVGLSWQAAWFPIVTGLLVGLGVRQAHKSLAGHVSYARGAVAGLIAAGAILGSDVVAREVFTRKASAASAPAAVDHQQPVKKDVDENAEDDEIVEEEVTEEVEFLPAGISDVDPSANAPTALGESDVLPFIFMAVGIFLAYEFARGTGTTVVHEAPAPVDDETDRGDA